MKKKSTKAQPKTLKMVYGAVGLDSNPLALVNFYLTVEISLVWWHHLGNNIPKCRKSKNENVITGGTLALASRGFCFISLFGEQYNIRNVIPSALLLESSAVHSVGAFDWKYF